MNRFKNWVLMAPAGSDEQGGGVGTTIATGVTATPTSTGSADAGQTTGNQQHLNHRETVDYFKRTQKLEAELADLRKKVGGNEPAPPPATPQGDLAQQLALRDAMSDLGFTADKTQREIMQDLFAVHKPTDVEAWVRKYGPTIGLKSSTATAATPGAPKPAAAMQSNLGNPGSSGSSSLPQDPRLIPRDIWNNLEPAERVRIAETWAAKSGGGDPNLFKRWRAPAKR
jgi:hypothetical protein